MMELEERPCFVQFETRAIEDRSQVFENGRLGFKDVIYIQVTQPGGKEVFEDVAEKWLKKQEVKVKRGDLPAQILESYKAVFKAFKEGQELPVNGTAIKGWQVISPAQQKAIIAVGIRTVEDLAQATEEAIAAIGMGARDSKQKAQTWLKSADQGKSTVTINDLSNKLERLEAKLKDSEEYIKLLEMEREQKPKEEKKRGRPKKDDMALDMDEI